MQSLDAPLSSSSPPDILPEALMEGADLTQQPYRLVVVTNREPYEVKQTDSELILKRTAGGLVSALDPVLRETKGMWICWEGTRNKIAELEQAQTPQQSMNLEELSDANEVTLPYDIKVVPLTENEINHYYYGYANTRLWPLFHYFPDKCDFSDENDWTSYYSANQKFAAKVVAETVPEDLIWVHDYQLFLVPGLIRKEAPDRHVGFFCHIPFPDYEIFRVLSKRREILLGMLGSDIIGFHTPDYVRHFLECVDKLLPKKNLAIDWDRSIVIYEEREIYVGAYPISIDFDELNTKAKAPAIRDKLAEIRAAYNTEYIGIGVDRLDYTKGILERLDAIRVFFETYPEYKHRMSFIQIASPTRSQVPMYQDLRDRVEQAVGRINGQLAEEGWVPIHYFNRSFSMDEILPYFLMADFALVTPLRDGMNLVAKEFCAARFDNNGVLLLSEMTGAAFELPGALRVNPYDFRSVAGGIHRALTMHPDERRYRMQSLRKTISYYNIQYWLENYMRSFQRVIQNKLCLQESGLTGL